MIQDTNVERPRIFGTVQDSELDSTFCPDGEHAPKYVFPSSKKLQIPKLLLFIASLLLLLLHFSQSLITKIRRKKLNILFKHDIVEDDFKSEIVRPLAQVVRSHRSQRLSRRLQVD